MASELPLPVIRTWKIRETIELEAASVFAALTDDLTVLWGDTDPVVLLAKEAQADELRHAGLCRKIYGAEPTHSSLKYQVQLGPAHLTRLERVQYASLAMSCVTETLSTALLIAMKSLAQPGIIEQTVHNILTDEINHSRIGWAELARQSQTHDLSWLADHIPKMITEAISSEITPMLGPEEQQDDLAPWGILAPKKSHQIMTETIHEVILPGLKEYNIHTKFPNTSYVKQFSKVGC